MKKAYDTLNYYNSNAKEFYNQTVFADFERIYQKVFMFLPKHSYIWILAVDLEEIANILWIGDIL